MRPNASRPPADVGPPVVAAVPGDPGAPPAAGTPFRAAVVRELWQRRRAVLAALVTTVASLAALAAAQTSSADRGPRSVVASGPAPPVAASPTHRYAALAEEAAATCPGLPPGVLHAIAETETRHGLDTRVSSAGAVGPMQFMPRTWAAYATDGDGDGRLDVRNPADAVHTAARHLCANGGADPTRLRAAIWNYNHSDAYVDRVLRRAAAYDGGG